VLSMSDRESLCSWLPCGAATDVEIQEEKNKRGRKKECML
jgi:hypothetical protein